MTELIELLEQCDAQGIRLQAAENDGLTIDAPSDNLTPAMIERLATHKVAILAILSGRDPPTN